LSDTTSGEKTKMMRAQCDKKDVC